MTNLKSNALAYLISNMITSFVVCFYLAITSTLAHTPNSVFEFISYFSQVVIFPFIIVVCLITPFWLCKFYPILIIFNIGVLTLSYLLIQKTKPNFSKKQVFRLKVVILVLWQIFGVYCLSKVIPFYVV